MGINRKQSKAILVVSFGTSVAETRKKTIEAIEESIRKEFTEYQIYRAFTSKMIIEKLKKENLTIMTVEEALDCMEKDGITEVLVQPTHIINGIENDNMIEVIRRKKENFTSLKVGNPLLHQTEDYKMLAKAIGEEYPVDWDTMLVLMGHGSAHYSNAAYPALEYVFRDLGYNNVAIGTVEGYPTIDEVIKQMKQQKKKKAILLPLMIVAGDHAINDMAGEEDSWKSQLEEAGYQVQCILKGLGELKQVQTLFQQHIKDAIEKERCEGN